MTEGCLCFIQRHSNLPEDKNTHNNEGTDTVILSNDRYLSSPDRFVCQPTFQVIHFFYTEEGCSTVESSKKNFIYFIHNKVLKSGLIHFFYLKWGNGWFDWSYSFLWGIERGMREAGEANLSIFSIV